MVETRLGDAQIKKFLRDTANEEKKEFAALTNRESQPSERSAVIKKMAEPRHYLSGFFYAISMIHGKDAAKYYENYFFQARSDEGIIE